jgi:hypothetical protein
LIYDTYSRYSEDIEAKYDMEISQWLIKIQDQDIYNSSDWAALITPRYVQDTNIADGVIVPGGKAYLEFKLDYSVVNVAFEMQGILQVLNANEDENAVADISEDSEINTDENANADMNDINAAADTELDTNEFKDFKVLGYTTVNSETNTESSMIVADGSMISKTYNLSQTENKVDIIRIYFTWYDGEGNEMDDLTDTAYRGEEISGSEYTNLKYKLTLNFNQINPSQTT